jgi:biopolymer transport protein ExbB
MSRALKSMVVFGLAAAVGASAALAQQKPAAPPAPPANAAQTLQQLLEQTRNARAQEAQQNAAREQAFMADRNKQAGLLAQARNDKAFQENRSKQLSAQFDANEKHLTELQAVLDAKGGNLGELFGVVRIVAGDVSSVLYNSLITAQYPKRDVFVSELSQAKALPSIDKLEKLWFEMQREMTETGHSVRFNTQIVQPDGQPEAWRSRARSTSTTCRASASCRCFRGSRIRRSPGSPTTLPTRSRAMKKW